jgi:hypothetical protein
MQQHRSLQRQFQRRKHDTASTDASPSPKILGIPLASTAASKNYIKKQHEYYGSLIKLSRFRIQGRTHTEFKLDNGVKITVAKHHDTYL